MSLPNGEELKRINRQHLESQVSLAERYLLDRLYYEVKMLREIVKQNPPEVFASAHCPHCFRDFPHAAHGNTCALDFHERQVIEPVLQHMKLLNGDTPSDAFGDKHGQ